MPKKQILGTTIIIVILSFVCMYIYDNYKVEVETTILVENSDDAGIKEYYSDDKNNFYLFKLDDVIIDYNDRTLKLNQALETKQIKMDFILGKVDKKYSLNNEKITFYQNSDFSLLECITEDGKHNYVFGQKTMDYKESLCEEPPFMCSFIKTYYVVDIRASKDNDMYYLTLSTNDEVETIKISVESVNTLKIGSTYEFKFGSLNGSVDTSIKDVFDNNILLDAKEVSATETTTPRNDIMCN